MDIYKYLPSIITAFLIAPLGYYVRERLKNLASSEDFSEALQQLKKSTTAVEAIKSHLNEKYWVQQQVWETKRTAYEEIISCLYLTQKSIQSWVEYFSGFTSCYVHLGNASCIEYDAEYERSYNEFVESEQREFSQKYESEDACNERLRLMGDTKVSFYKLETIFSIKSIYLHSRLSDVEERLTKLMDKFFDNLQQEEYEGFGEFQERLLEHHIECKELVSELISLVKSLAKDDLKLEVSRAGNTISDKH